MKLYQSLKIYFKFFLLYLLLAVMMMLLTGCQAAVLANNEFRETLKLGGSSTIEPLATQLAASYMAQHPDITVSVRGGGSGLGVKGVAYGGFQIGMASRSLSATELAQWTELQTTTIGHDGVALAINKSLYDAGIRELTLVQIAKIWRGDVLNWQELGGPNLPILLYDREEDSGTRDTFFGTIFGEQEPALRDVVGVFVGNEAVLSAITENSGAASILSLGWLREDVVGVHIINNLGESVAPTAENVNSGLYPISRNLNFVTEPSLGESGQQFIQYVLSPEGQALVAEAGYVPVSPE